MSSTLELSHTSRFALGLCILTGSLFATGDFATAAPPTDLLAGVTPNWDKNLPSASRFTTVFPRRGPG